MGGGLAIDDKIKTGHSITHLPICNHPA